MSDFVVHKGKRDTDGFVRHYGAAAKGLTFAPGKATQVELADGRSGHGSCLGCANAPCMQKHSSELTLPAILESYPGDPSEDVCPTDAIVWDKKAKVATVRADACIGCGLCAVRCPYGAISISSKGIASVEGSDPDGLVVQGATNGKHAEPARHGVVATTTSPAANYLSHAVIAINDAAANRLVRNLLHELGINARVRRKGDTNMRIDAVGYTRAERPFVAEIELSGSVLESPRALLEDVAIMHARYGIPVEDIDALSIIRSFPNVRSDYYQVIRDIESVVGIRCRSITLGAMIALLWNLQSIDGFAGDDFAVLKDGIDLGDSPGLEGAEEPYPGALRPAK